MIVAATLARIEARTSAWLSLTLPHLHAAFGPASIMARLAARHGRRRRTHATRRYATRGETGATTGLYLRLDTRCLRRSATARMLATLAATMLTATILATLMLTTLVLAVAMAVMVMILSVGRHGGHRCQQHCRDPRAHPTPPSSRRGDMPPISLALLHPD
jgi:hypothetical protein